MLNLKDECGVTLVSLSNAKIFRDGGWKLVNATMDYDINRVGENRNWYEVNATFEMPATASKHVKKHKFTGFSMGYIGEGSRGMIEFLNMFVAYVDEEYIFTYPLKPKDVVVLHLSPNN